LSDLKGILEEDRRGRRAPEHRAKRSTGPSTAARGWAGTLKQRVRVAKRLPQAMVKITSHNRGRKQVGARLHYISKEGELSLETDEGLSLDTPEEIDAYLDHWVRDFSRRKNGRDGMSLVMSLPHGTDKEAARSSARDFLQEVFADNHSYAFAAHDDKDHYHVHAVIKMRGHDGKQLVTDKADLRAWREAFAECAKAHGVHLDASPRYARGVGARSLKTEQQQIQDRDERDGTDTCTVEQSAAAEAKNAAAAARRRLHAGEQAMRATNCRERLEYAKVAVAVAKEARRLPQRADRLSALEMASSLAAYAVQMPRPRSRLEVMVEELGRVAKNKEVKPGGREAAPLVAQAVRDIRRQLSTFNTGRDADRVKAVNRELAALLPKKRARERDRDGPSR